MRAIKLYTLLLINIVSFFGTNEEVTAREAIEINKKLKFLKNIVKNLPNTWKFTVLDAENNNFLIRVGNLWHRSRVKYQFFIDNQIYSRDYINSTQNIMYYAEFLTNGKAFQAATSSEQDRKNMQKDIISAADNVITDLNNAMDALGDKADNKERVKIYIKVRSDFARKLNEIVLENSKGGTFDSEKFFISGSFRDIYQLIPGPGFDTNKTFLYTLNRKPNKARARYYFSDAEIDQWRESESLQLPLPPDTDGTSILSWLVYKDNFYAVKKIIELGVDVNDIGYFGETALHWAAAFGRKDIYFYLLEKNADIDASYTGIDDKTILSPTAIAVIGGIWGILPNTELSGLSDDPYKTKEYLQENRKNTYYGDDECQVCLGKLMILQDLLEKKSKNINDELLFHALLRGNASMIKLIIDRAEEQNISLDYGEALAVAVGLQRDDAASLIWERGKFSKDEKQIALQSAARVFNLRWVEKLLEDPDAGIDIDKINPYPSKLEKLGFLEGDKKIFIKDNEEIRSKTVRELLHLWKARAVTRKENLEKKLKGNPMIFREEGHGDYLDEKEAEAYRFYNEILESIHDIFKKYPDSIDEKTLFALASLANKLQQINKLPSFTNFLPSTHEEKLIIYEKLNAVGNDLHNNIDIFKNKYADITNWDDMYKKITIKFRNRNSHTPSNEILVAYEGNNGKLTEIYTMNYESETNNGSTIQNQHVFNVEHTATNNEEKEKAIVTALEKIPELAEAINAVLAREIGTNSKIKNVKLEITPVNPQTN